MIRLQPLSERAADNRHQVITSSTSLFFFTGNRRFGMAMLCALVLLLVQMYLNTGTLSAYAVTLDNPFVMEGYIVNYDYVHYRCNYDFIMGGHVDTWGWVLRRELFYILSFPFFQLYGFYLGGLLSACIITLLSCYFFIRFVYRNIGIRAAYVIMALLAAYPGIMYWIGSPFAQVMIVPCCCWIYAIMWKMQRSDSLAKHTLYLLIISILFTAYDLFVFFLSGHPHPLPQAPSVEADVPFFAGDDHSAAVDPLLAGGQGSHRTENREQRALYGHSPGICQCGRCAGLACVGQYRRPV